jgi:hypothetical protein
MERQAPWEYRGAGLAEGPSCFVEVGLMLRGAGINAAFAGPFQALRTVLVDNLLVGAAGRGPSIDRPTMTQRESLAGFGEGACTLATVSRVGATREGGLGAGVCDR